MNTIWQDFNSPIPKIKRVWIRLPIALIEICIGSPIIIVAGVAGGILDGVIESYKLSIILIFGDGG